MANNSEEGQGSQRAVVPVMMMVMKGWQARKADNLSTICEPIV
jgi:hypothetical protein